MAAPDSEKSYADVAAELLERVRSRRPLIHHMTNWVVMNDTANATLALGASPVMCHAKEEVAEMVAMAGALVLNPGTLYPELVDAMIIAGKRANEKGVPIVYDPVGVGATAYRNQTADRILKDIHLDVVRGNSGEIGALAGAGGVVKGVDSVQGVADPVAVSRDLARRRSTVVAITGKRDMISDGTRVAGRGQRARDAHDDHRQRVHGHHRDCHLLRRGGRPAPGHRLGARRLWPCRPERRAPLAGTGIVPRSPPGQPLSLEAFRPPERRARR